MRRSLFHKLNVLEWSRLSPRNKKNRLPGFKWRSSTSSAASRLLRRPESRLLYFTNSLGVQPLLWYLRLGRGQPDSELLHHLHIACSVIAEPMRRGDVWFRMIRQVTDAPPPFLASAGTYQCFVLWKHSLIAEVGRINEFVGADLRLFPFILMPFEVLLCSKSCSFRWNIWMWHASWLVQSLQHPFQGSFDPRFTAKDSKDNNSSQVNQMQHKWLIKTCHRSQERFS